MTLTPQSRIEPNTNVYIKNGRYTIEFYKDAVTGKLIRHIFIKYNDGACCHDIQPIDKPNATYANLFDDKYDYAIHHNVYSMKVLETADKKVSNGDYVATTNGFFIVDIPEEQAVVTLEPEKLILPLTNVVTGEHITMPILDVTAKRDDAFYSNLYALYTGEPTETRGYLKAAHQFDKGLKKLIDRTILKHALTSEKTFKQVLGDLCDQHRGYINTRGTYNLDGSDKQFYTSLDGDNIITEEAKYDTSDCALHLTKRTATPLRLYMTKVKNTQTRGGLYDAIQLLTGGDRFTQTQHFRPRPTILER